MQLLTLLLPVAFTAFAAPVIGLFLALSSAAQSRHHPPMCDIQFPHRRASSRRSRRQPPPTSAIPVDGWLLHRRLPPIFIVLPLLL
jgi:hypothetical protein